MLPSIKLPSGLFRVLCMVMILVVLLAGHSTAAASGSSAVWPCAGQGWPGAAGVCAGAQRVGLNYVSVYAFEVEPADEGMRISWSTATEIDKVGFYIFRQQDPAEVAVRITPEMIAVQNPGSMTGEYYELIDDTAEPDTAYRYALQTVLVDGSFYMMTAEYEPPTDPQYVPAEPPVWRVFLPGIRR